MRAEMGFDIGLPVRVEREEAMCQYNPIYHTYAIVVEWTVSQRRHQTNYQLNHEGVHSVYTIQYNL